MVIVIGAILGANSGDCDNPIRGWLIGQMVALLVQGILAVLVEVIAKAKPSFESIRIVNGGIGACIGLFLLIWWIIG